MIRVFLVDDQQLLRRGLQLLLRACEGITVVGEACGGVDALHQLRAMPTPPDVVLTDYQMPTMDGLALLTTMSQEMPTIPVIILTTFDQDSLVTTAVDAGAAGFLLKDISPEKLGEAICSVASGEMVIDPRVTRAVLRRPTPAADPFDVLTKAEQTVAELVGAGQSNREIASSLFLAEGTVRNHISSILRKLQVRDRIALALLVAHRRRGPVDRT